MAERIAYLLQRPLDRWDPGALRAAGVAHSLAAAGRSVTLVAPTGRSRSVNSSLRRLLDPNVATMALPESTGSEPHPFAVACNRLGATSVIGHGANAALLAALAASGVPAAARILDVCDWHETPPGTPGRAAATVQDSATMESEALRGHPALVVSSLLERRFAATGSPTLRVPPLFSAKIRTGSRPLRVDDGAVHVAFAGNAARLDAGTVSHVLSAAGALNRPRRRVVVHVIGHGMKIVAALARLGPEAMDAAVFHGHLPHEEATAIVAACDYVVLQRRRGTRWVDAGFPSKVVESWVLGTPVIANVFSDLDEYLLDGDNAVVLDSDAPDAMMAGLQRAVSLHGSFDRAAIRSWSDQHFTPQAHSAELAAFIAGWPPCPATAGAVPPPRGHGCSWLVPGGRLPGTDPAATRPQTTVVEAQLSNTAASCCRIRSGSASAGMANPGSDRPSSATKRRAAD